MSQRKKKVQTIKAWGGFCDGKLHLDWDRDYNVSYWAVFPKKADGRKEFEDVRPVQILVEAK